MKPLVLSVAIVCLSIVPSLVCANAPQYEAEKTGAFFKEWLLCGPFPNPVTPDGRRNVPDAVGWNTDYLLRHGGETNLRAREGQVESFDGGEAEWFAFQSKEAVVSLEDAIASQEFVLGYAFCEIKAPKSHDVLLAVGSDDGVRIWLNGEDVWSHAVGRRMRADEDIVPVRLKRGKNTVLLKVENGLGGWAFSFRLLPFAPESFQNRRFFTLQTTGDGRIAIRPANEDTYLKRIFRKVDFQLKTSTDQPELLWSGSWPFEQTPVLPEPSGTYREYLLEVDCTYVNGLTDRYVQPVEIGNFQRYSLFAGGKSEYRIVVGENAGESERWAAHELRSWLREAGGADLPIVDDTVEFHDKEIIIGVNRHVQHLLKDKTPVLEPLDERFTIVNIGPSLLIYGGTARGTLYGVIDFLESYLGCRWYTPSVSVIPKRDRFDFVSLDKRDGPGLRVRNNFYYEAFDPIWAARNRSNGAMGYREQPGGVESYWAVHTFYFLIPPDEFFKEHPEYFSLVDGQRKTEHAQLCLTNPDVFRITVERLKGVMRSQPEHLIYCVSQNDCAGPCQCQNCQAIVEREGSQSGPVVEFVNRVADAVQEEFPDKFVGTLAYQYTRKPPKTLKPRDNVVIRLCSIECCFAHSFRDCPSNQSFMEDLENWAKIAPHMYIWDYVVDFSHYIMPHPNFYALQPNLQAFRDNRSIGIMEQACYNTRGGEFAELRAYVLSKLLWNPDLENLDAAIDDFMYGYYGRAGQYVRAYFDDLHGRITPDTHLHCFDSPDNPIFAGDFIWKADRWFDRAETVAENETIRRRVEMARLPVMYLKLMKDLSGAAKDGTYARFKAICEREGINRVKEWNPIAETFKELDRALEAQQ